jgi:ESCRT-I complex subunit VPS28
VASGGSAAPTQIIDVNREMKLATDQASRAKYDMLADLYSILVATEALETAFNRSAITDDEYTPACKKLITQFRNVQSALARSSHTANVSEFVSHYGLSVPLALQRLTVEMVPATVGAEEKNDALLVSRTVAAYISVTDTLEMNDEGCPVDDLLPFLRELKSYVAQHARLPASHAAAVKVNEWVTVVGNMAAHEDVSEEQVRQMKMDMGAAHASFNDWLEGR